MLAGDLFRLRPLEAGDARAHWRGSRDRRRGARPLHRGEGLLGQGLRHRGDPLIWFDKMRLHRIQLWVADANQARARDTIRVDGAWRELGWPDPLAV
jgi:hypothetical protein